VDLIGKTRIILQLNCDRTCGPPNREENRHDQAPMHGSATAWAEGPQSAATGRLGPGVAGNVSQTTRRQGRLNEGRVPLARAAGS
jgi:hypothetical protein